jgi:hypothetical protein
MAKADPRKVPKGRTAPEFFGNIGVVVAALRAGYADIAHLAITIFVLLTAFQTVAFSWADPAAVTLKFILLIAIAIVAARAVYKTWHFATPNSDRATRRRGGKGPL